MAIFSDGLSPSEKLEPRGTISRRSPSLDSPISPFSEPALDHFSPKLVGKILSKENLLLSDSMVAVVSSSVENARIVGGQNRLLHAYPPLSPHLVQPSTCFKASPTFENSDLDVSADLPPFVLNDPKTGVKPPSAQKAYISNREETTSERHLLTSPPLSYTAMNSSSGNRVSPVRQSLTSPTSGSTVKSCVAYEENIARDPYSPTPSPSFEIIRIYPGCDVEFSEPTTQPLPNPSHSRKLPSRPSVGTKNSLAPKFEEVVLIPLAWTFAFTCGFGFLLLLAEWTHNAYACSLMVFLSLNIGAVLVINKCVTKGIPVSKFKDPVDVVIRNVDLEPAGFGSPEHGHSSVVQINGRFEISSLRSSQDIFQSELLMNGQVISSTPRRDALYPGTSTLTPMSSNMSLTVFGKAATSSETGLRTRLRRPVSPPHKDPRLHNIAAT